MTVCCRSSNRVVVILGRSTVIATSEQGRLVIVGSGIGAVSQLTFEAAGWIKAADVVCYLLADPLTERWIIEHAKATEDLARLHRTDRPRMEAYRAMADRMVELARGGRRVVGVFYGHPGVFTSPTHWAIAAARAQGIPARMLPAVSAEDCLFADLGIDPGDGACQSFEATDMIIRARVPATDAHLIVWQVGVVAALDLRAGGGHIEVLVHYLERFYPGTHQVTHYQAAQNVVTEPVIDTVALSDLGTLPLTVTSTLYVPPVGTRDYDLDLAAAVELDGEGPEHPGSAPDLTTEPPDADPAAGTAPDWYRPVADAPSRLAALVMSLSIDPGLIEAVAADPQPYLEALGLDVIERWAFLARDQTWINACIREGSGPAAAVALGAARTVQEAQAFFVHPRDGRLVRRKT